MRKEQKKKRFLNQEYAMMRYKEGATDQEIAQETGVCKYTVSAFRKRHLIVLNFPYLPGVWDARPRFWRIGRKAARDDVG